MNWKTLVDWKSLTGWIVLGAAVFGLLAGSWAAAGFGALASVLGYLCAEALMKIKSP